MTDRWGRSMREAGQPPVFPGHTRRQALPFIGVAACWDWCAGRIARPFGPPHPPAKKAPPTQGKPREGGGAGHSFLQCRNTGTAARLVEYPPQKSPYPRGCMAGGLFWLFKFPQVTPFFPRVALFFPHGCFSGYTPSSSSSLCFKRERERERRRGPKTGIHRSVFEFEKRPTHFSNSKTRLVDEMKEIHQ